MSILDFFPKGKTPRSVQADILTQIEANWNGADVFVITAPTGSGKSAIAETIARWRSANQGRASITVPTNILLRPYEHLPTIKRRSLYACEPMGNSCADQEVCCRGVCPYTKARRLTKIAGIRASTYHGYVAHRMFSETMIVDEAHNLVDMLRESGDVILRRSKFKFPDTIATQMDLVEWLQHEMRVKGETKALKKAYDSVVRIKLAAAVEFYDDFTRGKRDRLLRLKAITSAGAGTYLWPSSKVKKLVLLSATINEHDVAELGLKMRRVYYLTCPSPIPPECRPVRFEPTANMALQYRGYSVPLLAAKLNALLPLYPDKGMVHVPYDMAEAMRPLLTDPRFAWHNKRNKMDVFADFVQSPPSEGRVLIASGMYEGVDLPYDAARWQVIGVVPFLPLSEYWIRERAAQDNDWYIWSAIKRLVQAAGRVSRAEDDYGITLITDMQFERLLRKHRRLFPQFFLDAIGA